MDTSALRTAVADAAHLLQDSTQELTELDSVAGDGDLGITVSAGARGVGAAMAELGPGATVADLLRAAGGAFARGNPSSFAALSGAGLLAAAGAVGARTRIDRATAADALQAAADKIAERGRAVPGERTVLDALVPSIAALRTAPPGVAPALLGMIEAARAGVEATRSMTPARGRAAWVGERGKGHPDGGAVAYLRLLEALRQVASSDGTARVPSTDPRTGHSVLTDAVDTDPEHVDALCEQAGHAAAGLAALGRGGRAQMLEAMAAALDADRDEIVAVADAETALGRTRLDGELTRTTYQLRAFARVLDEGSYLQATIDHAADTPMGARPDLRRMLAPLGPVAVFGASNFPLAFSAPGGDTAAALAAGCPVVVKAHPAHPRTSLRTFAALHAAALAAGAPAGALSLVFGQDAGTRLVAHPAVRAVGFTGSERGGRALFDIAMRRPDPIPFYGELGSLNPLVVTPAAAAERGAAIAAGLASSITLGAGQFCTKPGLVLIVDDEDGRELVRALTKAIDEVAPAPLLTDSVRAGFEDGVEALRADPTVDVLSTRDPRPADLRGFEVVPGLVAVAAADLAGSSLVEHFGPMAVVVRCADEAELVATVGRLPGALTGSVHRGRAEDAHPVFAALGERVGRVVFDGFPTGVAVSWGMTHGGPWPATTNPLHTSVGMTSIGRFLRPVSWQNAPQAALPVELRDGPVDIPRRVDDDLTLPASGS